LHVASRTEPSNLTDSLANPDLRPLTSGRMSVRRSRER
jgi:hypothetical protein